MGELVTELYSWLVDGSWRPSPQALLQSKHALSALGRHGQVRQCGELAAKRHGYGGGSLSVNDLYLCNCIVG